MPTGSKGERRPTDAIGNAVNVKPIATEEDPENFGPAKPKKNEAAAVIGQGYGGRAERRYRAEESSEAVG